MIRAGAVALETEEATGYKEQPVPRLEFCLDPVSCEHFDGLDGHMTL
jgi:hypothetical protein